MLDFKIKDNLILLKSSIVAIFKVEPIDIFQLDEEQSNYFNEHIKRVINYLKEEKIQLITRSRYVINEDYIEHFNTLRNINYINPTQNILINEYIKELKKLIQLNNINILEYYLIFKVKTNLNDAKSIVSSINKLEALINVICSAFSDLNIYTHLITNEDKNLEKLIRSFLQI